MESSENYLESILMLYKKNGSVRSVDIAADLGFSKPSVSVAMKKLKKHGYINVDKDGLIELTPAGLNIAKSIYERHTFISKWLMSIGVDEETAINDACKIEHVISDESFEAIKKLNEK